MPKPRSVGDKSDDCPMVKALEQLHQDRKTVKNDFYNFLRPDEFVLTLFLVWCGIDR